MIRRIINRILKKKEEFPKPSLLEIKQNLSNIRHNFADLSKIELDLGYVTKYNFIIGLKKHIQWAKNQNLEEDNYENSLHKLIVKGLLSK